MSASALRQSQLAASIICNQGTQELLALASSPLFPECRVTSSAVAECWAKALLLKLLTEGR